jgi:hypothetical protein
MSFSNSLRNALNLVLVLLLRVDGRSHNKRCFTMNDCLSDRHRFSISWPGISLSESICGIHGVIVSIVDSIIHDRLLELGAIS